MRRFSWLLILTLLLAVPVAGVASQGDVEQPGAIGLICDNSLVESTGGLLTIGSPIIGAGCEDSGGVYGAMGVEYPDGRWRIR